MYSTVILESRAESRIEIGKLLRPRSAARRLQLALVTFFLSRSRRILLLHNNFPPSSHCGLVSLFFPYLTSPSPADEKPAETVKGKRREIKNVQGESHIRRRRNPLACFPASLKRPRLQKEIEREREGGLTSHLFIYGLEFAFRPLRARHETPQTRAKPESASFSCA